MSGEQYGYVVWNKVTGSFRGRGPAGPRSTTDWVRYATDAFVFEDHAAAEDEIVRAIERGDAPRENLRAVPCNQAGLPKFDPCPTGTCPRPYGHGGDHCSVTTGTDSVTLDKHTMKDVQRAWATVLQLWPLTFFDLDPEKSLRVEVTERAFDHEFVLGVDKVQEIVTKLSAWLAQARGDGPPTPREQAAARSFMVEVAISQVPPEAAFIHRCAYCGSPTSQGPIRLNEKGKFYPSCCPRDECLSRWDKVAGGVAAPSVDQLGGDGGR